MVFESSEAFSPPAACEGPDFPFFLESLWVDDGQLASVASSFGIPISLTEIDYATGVGGSEGIWSWLVGQGAATAEIHVYDLPGEAVQRNPSTTRYFWPDGAGIGYWDWRNEFSDDLIKVWGANANFPPPTLYGRSALPDEFVGTAYTFEQDGNVDASVRRFSDTACRHPL